MDAVLYQFAKRYNSTKTPASGDAIATLQVQLKDGTNMMRPVFLISIAAVPFFNMVQWNNHYYRVLSITNVRNNLFELECEIDVLTTHRSRIFETTAFIEYDGYANTEIIDDRLPVKTTETTSVNFVTIAPGLMTGQWKVAVTCTGSNSTSTFLLTPSQVQNLVNSTDFNNWFNTLWTDINNDVTALDNQISANIGDQQTIAAGIENAVGTDDIYRWGARANNLIPKFISNALAQSVKYVIHVMAKFFRRVMATPNAMDCIKAATIIPWDVVGDGSSTTIMLGELNTGVTALPVYNPVETGTVYVNIPWQASDWRRNAPYHQIYLYLPFIGVTELSPSDLIDCTQLTIRWSLNKVSGAVAYQVTTDKNSQVGMYSANCGIPYPIGASNISPVSAFTSLIAGAGAVASAGSSSVAAAAMARASLSAIKPTICSVGNGGGGAASGLDMRARIWSVFHDTVVAPNSIADTIGTPTMAQAKLNTRFGYYVKTRGASVGNDGAAAEIMTDPEREEINRLLDGGVYLE